MSDYLISEETLNNLGDAVRTLSGDNSSMSPIQMINNINETKSAINALEEHKIDSNAHSNLLRLINKGEIANEYVWSKSTISGAWFLVESSTKTWTNDVPSDSNFYRTLYTTAKAVNGEVVLSNPESVFWQDVVGKYVEVGGVKYKITGFEGAYTSLEVVALSAQQGTTSEVVGYVNASSADAYPVDDGYAYTALGKIGEKVQIATGSYTGTGTNGSANPTSITFDFEPKFVYVCAEKSYAKYVLLWVYGAKQVVGTINNGSDYQAVTLSNKTLSWYCGYNQGAPNQLNASGVAYKWIAIG